MTKFLSLNHDGHHWLCVKLSSGKIIYLHKMARLGDCHCPGQKFHITQ